MHKIYTCKYFAIWNKYTHISKSIFTLCSQANSVRISILLGAHTCYRPVDTFRLLIETQRQQLSHYLCTGLVLADESLNMLTKHLCALIRIKMKGEDGTMKLVKVLQQSKSIF